MPDISLYQALSACHQRLAALCEIPDFSRFYPSEPDGGFLLQVEEVVCAFAKDRISFKAAQAEFVKLATPMIHLEVSPKIRSLEVARDVRLWLSVNRRFVMSVDFLLRQIMEEDEIRQWLIQHEDNLRSEVAQRSLSTENMEALADWFNVGREMEIALVMVWADSMAASCSMGCPNSAEAREALSRLRDVITQQAVVPAARKLVESEEELDYSKVPVFTLDYETQEDFQLIGQAGEGVSLEAYRESQRVARMAAEQAGKQTVYVLIKASAYLRWLAANKRKNNLRSRMGFAGATWIKSGGMKL